MNELTAMFDGLSPEWEKLAAFGFKPSAGGYVYRAPLVDGQFEAVVSVTDDGRVTADVVDAETGEVYALVKVAAVTGAFVGKIRSELETVLTEVAAKCFYADRFKSAAARSVIAYARKKYGDELEFLWPKFPMNAILRRKDNAKWYAVLLNLPSQKLGLSGEGKLDIIDLRAAADDIARLVDGEAYFPGYHMNKSHWVTLCLDGRTAAEEICRRLDESYRLAGKK